LPNPSMLSENNRIYGLDILRTLAILPVIFQHGGMFLQNTGTSFPWIPLPDGVEIFFVLSGFLIGGILLRQLNQDEFSSLKAVKHFWLRRWFRTLPAYYLVLLLNIIFIYFNLNGESPDNLSWRFFVFAQNLFQPLQGPFWESWSLAVEEWFYLLFPMLLFFIAKLNFLSKENRFTTALLLFTFVPFLLRVLKGIEMQVDGYGWDIHFRKMVFVRLDSIAIGIWMAWFKIRYPKQWTFKPLWLMVIGFACFFYLDTHQAADNSFFNKVLRFPLYSLCFALTLPFFDSIKTGSGLALKIFTHLSKISYSMYLINLGLVGSVIHHLYKPEGTLAAIVAYLVYWVVVVVGAGLLYKYFEKPCTDWREKWS
jgi:peptidoglycan/LPS O-acetylase OafA/YrhL